MNTSATSVDDKDILTKPLVTPLVRVIDLQFPLGTVVTARNKFGVTIKDAMDAIYKTQKKKVSFITPKPPRLIQNSSLCDAFFHFIPPKLKYHLIGRR